MNIDKLKAAAEKAKPGPWERVLGDDSSDVIVPGGNADTGENMIADCHWNERHQANATFIAAADPTTILALIERLEGRDALLERALPWLKKLRAEALNGIPYELNATIAGIEATLPTEEP